ncbi:MAG: YfhO family protein [bacterium]
MIRRKSSNRVSRSGADLFSVCWRQGAVIIGIGYLLSLVFWAIRLKGHSVAFMDSLEYTFPEKWVNLQLWRAGHIPLWNPWIACGVPHLANLQSAPFYPLFWIWNLTGLFDWFFWLALAQGLLAAVGFYLWIRESGARGTLAALTAVGFAGSALMVQYWGFPTHLATAAWVPWIFWITIRFQREPSIARWTGIVLFWSLDFLAGYVYFTFYAAILWMVWLIWIQRPTVKMWAAYGAAAFTALGITACQWIPFVDFLGYLNRPGISDDVYSLHWINFLTLLSPNILGVPGTPAYRGDYPAFIFNNFYLGLIPLGLYLLGLGFSRGREKNFWKMAGVVTLLWTAGGHFLVFKILPIKWLGVLDPAKAAFIFIFGAFTFLGIWLQPLLDRLFKKKKLPWGVLILALVWFGEVLWVPFRILPVVKDPYLNPGMIHAASVVRQSIGTGRLVALRREGLPAAGSGADFSDSILEHFLGFPPNSNAVWGIPSVGGYLSIFPDGYQNLQTYLRHGFPYAGRILDAAGAGLFLTQDPLTPFKYRTLGSWGPYLLTRNAGALTPFWTAEAVRSFPSRADVFEQMLKPGAFLENQVYTERAPNGGAERLPPPLRSLNYEKPGWMARWSGFWKRQDASQVEPSQESPCRLGVQVNLRNPGYVVFSQTFTPGWRAWMDGKPESIFRADGLFMAVAVSQAGLHRVDFRYEPTAFRLGLFLTLFFLIGLPLTLMVWRFRRFSMFGKVFSK